MKRTNQGAKRNLVGNRIREARMRCTPSVSQEDLAGRLALKGITLDQTAVSRIESQTRYLMDYELIAIAKALRVSVAWLVSEVE